LEAGGPWSRFRAMTSNGGADALLHLGTSAIFLAGAGHYFLRDIPHGGSGSSPIEVRASIPHPAAPRTEPDHRR
jgi:hypothetical protein